MEPYPFPSPGSSHFTKSLSLSDEVRGEAVKGELPLTEGKKTRVHPQTLIPGLFLWDPFSTETAETGPFLQVPLSKRG